jgi:signal transduction histidine kinase/ActR/RegA family two-component response regulator
MRDSLQLVATSGLVGPGATSAGLRRALASIAERAVGERKAFRLLDVRSDRQELRYAGEIAALGCMAALAVPIVRNRRTLGVLLLLFAAHEKVDDGSVAFVETVCSIIGDAFANEAADESPDSARVRPNQASTTGIVLLGASVAHQLEGPVSALDLQLEEQRRLLSELRLLADDGDTALGGTVAELAELTDEIAAAISRLRDTTHQLTQLGDRQRNPEATDLAELAREAVAVVRPWLEARGIALETQLNPGGFVSAQRDAIMQVVLDIITIAAELGEGATSSPRVTVHTQQEGDRTVLSVDDVGPALDSHAMQDIHRHPFSGSLPDERRRLVLRLAGDVAAAHGGHLEVLAREGGGSSYRLVIPSIASSAQSSNSFALASSSVELTNANVHEVLVVDDDPVFSRAARRALRPHRVRESATASEAELQLLEQNYVPSVIVCDLMLPGSDGTDLHARIRQVRPDIAARFLFVTGGTLNKTTADYIRESGCLALQKPIDFTRLRRHLSRCTVEVITANLSRTLKSDVLHALQPTVRMS